MSVTPVPIIDGKKRCSICKLDVEAENYTKTTWTSSGLTSACRDCTLIKNQKARHKNPEAYNRRSREYKARRRLQVLTHYSHGTPSCACCKETIYEFLAVDHIDGGGTQHREVLRKQGKDFYNWLFKSDFPEGFQVLCHNCNMAKGFYGICPHRRLDEQAT